MAASDPNIPWKHRRRWAGPLAVAINCARLVVRGTVRAARSTG